MAKEVKFTITVSEGTKDMVDRASERCNVSMAMVGKIAIDHLLQQDPDVTKQIIDNYVHRAKLNNMLTKDEKIIIDAKKRLKEIDIELEKSKSRSMNIKTVWEGQDGYKSSEEVKQQIEAGRKEWGLTPEEMIKRK